MLLLTKCKGHKSNAISPVHLDLENDLILSLYFFQKCKKIASGGLISSLKKFGLILYLNFFQKIINSELVIFTT